MESIFFMVVLRREGSWTSLNATATKLRKGLSYPKESSKGSLDKSRSRSMPQITKTFNKKLKKKSSRKKGADVEEKLKEHGHEPDEGRRPTH